MSILDQLTARFGRMDHLTQQILQQANKYRGDMPLHTLHVLQAAIATPWSDPMLARTPHFNRLLTDESIRRSYVAAIRGRLSGLVLGTNASDNTLNITQALKDCFEQTRAHSFEDTMAFVTLIWVMLEIDADVRDVFDIMAEMSEIALDDLRQELKVLLPRRSTSPMALGAAADRFLHEVVPSDDRKYARRHRSKFRLVLSELNQRNPTEIVIVTGMHGSPLDRADKVLADLFAAGDYMKFETLRHQYTRVFSLDIGTVRAQPRELARQIITRAQHQAADERALLVLHRFQLLAHKPDGTVESDVDHEILALLTVPDEHGVIGLYENSDEKSPQPYQVLPNLNIRSIPLDGYTPAHTLANIRDNYQWDFDLAPDAFKTVFTLERTIYVRGRRKTLPYLAIELAQETMEAVLTEIDGATSAIFKDVAMAAGDTLKHMQAFGELAKAAIVIDATIPEQISSSGEGLNEETAQRMLDFRSAWTELFTTIAESKRAIEEFVQRPVIPNGDSQRWCLTRTLIDVQLFGSGIYEFRIADAFEHEYQILFPEELGAIGE